MYPIMNKINERIKEQMTRYNSADPVVRSKALEEIIEDHRRFITHIINKHFPSYVIKHFEDMFEYGVIGLLEALPRFNPDKSKPTTFFGPYIIHEIFNYIGVFLGQMTQHYAAKLSKVNKARVDLESEGIENPTIMDLAMKSGLKPEVVMKAISMQTAGQTQYFSSDEFFFENMEGDHGLQPETQIIQQEGKDTIYASLNQLPVKMREVVVRKLGLGEHEAQNNEQIGEAVGIAPGSVRQVYNQAIERLRDSDISDFFASQYRSSTHFMKEPVALVPEETAERLIATLLEFELGDEQCE
jgi:RNA polymerase sigma factor (sigma-70 family)